MAKKDVFNKLPSNLQTDVNKKFFDSTFEQVFSSVEKESINGYIGRREGGSYDPLKDFYVPEPSKERTWNQLEPIALSESTTGVGSNEVFLQDLLNYIENEGGNTGNHDRLFRSEQYSFAPPIDIDKYTNYSSYLWKTDFTGQEVVISDVDDSEIEANIIGNEGYTTTDGFVFTSDVIVRFEDSASYNDSYQVTGVGSEFGIELHLRYADDKSGNARPYLDTNPDYTTVDFGARNNNDWSANNFWFHKSTLSAMSAQNGLDLSINAQQARRPILSFDKDLELYGYGTEAHKDIEFATIDSPTTIDGKDGDIIITPDGDVTNVSFPLSEDDRIVFLGDSVPIERDTLEQYKARTTPYVFTVMQPFSEAKDNVFSVVRRSTTLPLVYFASVATGLGVNFTNTSFSDTLDVVNASPLTGDPYSVNNNVAATQTGALEYTVLATDVLSNANTNFSDERIFVYEVFDTNGIVSKDSYTAAVTISGSITIDFDVAPDTFVEVEFHVVLGKNDIINPDWYELSPNLNDVTYTVDVQDHIEEELAMVQQANPLEYQATMTDIEDPNYVKVYVDGVIIDESEFLWTSVALTKEFTVVFYASVVGVVTAKVKDGTDGLIDGNNMAEQNMDLVDIYVNANVVNHAVLTNGALTYNINTGIDNVTEDHIVSIKITDSNNENVQFNNTIVDSVSYSGETVTITLSALPDSLDDIMNLHVREVLVGSIGSAEYVWKASKRTTSNFVNIPNYGTQWLLLPYENDTDFAIHGDAVVVKNAGAPYDGKSFYFDSRKWEQELDSTDASSDNSRGTSINTPPKFQLYFSELGSDGLPITIGNDDEFPDNTFTGSEIFSYKIDETSGIVDPYLNMQLEYRNRNQNSEIVFEHDLETVRYSYSVNKTDVEIPGYYYFRQTTSSRVVEFDYTWARNDEKTKLRVIDRAVYVDGRYSVVQNQYINSIDELRIPLSVYPVQTGSAEYDILGFRNGNAIGQGREIDSGDVIEDIVWDFYFDNNTQEVVYYVKNNDLSDYDVFEYKTYSEETLDESSAGYYEVPAQLEDNPSNDEITDVTMSDLIPHFSSIISNQSGFIGTALGSRNNYRDTDKDVSLGDKIIQTSAPLLKAMISTSEDHLDILRAVEFSASEYTRYKDKIVATSRQMIREGWYPTASFQNVSLIEQQFDEVITRVSSSIEYNGAFVGGKVLPWGSSYVDEVFIVDSTEQHTIENANDVNSEDVLTLVYEVTDHNLPTETSVLLRLEEDYVYGENNVIIMLKGTTFGSTIRVRIYSNIESAKIPSTPAKCGMMQTHKPEIKVDNSYATPTWVIIGHDGAKTPCYTSEADILTHNNMGEDSLDLRDKMLLEMENRIYNNITQQFVDSYDKLINEYQFIEGNDRKVDYSLEEFNNIIIRDFLEWNHSTGANYQTNDTLDLADWKTWNYSAANPSFAGSWKGIYTYLYDTVSPNETPWEMLGFTSMPDWWVGEYGNEPYTSANDSMWRDIIDGVVLMGDRQGVYDEFKRPHMLGTSGLLILPVDSMGDLLAPHVIDVGIVEPTDLEKGYEWKFGDFGPTEYSWRVSSSFNFSLVNKIFLMSPNRFCEFWWDRSKVIQAPISPNQVVDYPELKRRNNSTLEVHQVEGTALCGYQRYVYDRIKFLGKNPKTEFQDIINGSTVKLAHRLAGYTNADTFKVLLEGSAFDSTNTNLVVPRENYEIKIHTGEVVEFHRYSGVMVRIAEDGYQVMGYDRRIPEFRYYGRSDTGRARQVNVGGKPATFRNFKNDGTYSGGSYVKYNGVFYQSKIDQVVSDFDSGSWTKLADLPTVGGDSISYVKEYDVNKEIIIEYNTTFPDKQSLFDFLIGYGDWLAVDGWNFDNVDSSTGKVQDWFESAESTIFWLTNSWAVGNTLQVSAGSEKLNLTVTDGYPADVREANKGAGNVLSVDGVPYNMDNAFVNREDQTISVANVNGNAGIYFLAVNSKETEHVIVFDNTTEFNDRLYDPLLGIRVERLEVRGQRTSNWFGKYEADGYIIDGDTIKPNFDNLVEESRYYYDATKTLDNQNIEDAAKHLIGFEHRDYLSRLRMFDDIQYQLYKGMLPEKGTYRPLDAIARADSVSANGDVNVYEMWALKMGELGDVLNSRSLELKIRGDDVVANPQMVNLVYPSMPSNTGEIRRVYLVDCNHVYVNVPVVRFWDGTYDSSVDSTSAFRLFDDTEATITLDDNGRISEIVVTSQSGVYSEAPELVLYDIPSNDAYFTSSEAEAGNGFTAFDKVDINHEATTDVGNTIISNFITEDNNGSDAIVIDIDDSDKWLSVNRLNGNDKLLPTINELPKDSTTKNAGYVHLDDAEITSFLLSNVGTAIETYSDDVKDKTVWIAELEGTSDRFDWSTYNLLETDISNNSLGGRLTADGKYYDYTPANATKIGEILNVQDVDGNVLVNGIDVTPDPYDPDYFDVWPADSLSVKRPNNVVELNAGTASTAIYYTSKNATDNGFNNSRMRITVDLSQLPASDFLPSGDYEGWVEQPYIQLEIWQSIGGVSKSSVSEKFKLVGENQKIVFEADIAPDAAHTNFSIITPKDDPTQLTVFTVNAFDVDKVDVIGINPDGSVVSEKVEYDIDLSKTENLFFVESRFESIDEWNNRPDGVNYVKRWIDKDSEVSNTWSFKNLVNGVSRQGGALIDSSLMGNLSVYEGSSDRTLSKSPVYDPIKGFIPTLADRNITYINDSDPSRYSVAGSNSMTNDSLSFSKDNVGQLWWDTSTAKYVHYEQGDENYRVTNWGRLFPESSVDVYEWVESPTVPADYDQDGTPKNVDEYVIRDAYDFKTETYVEKYYFWVKDRTVRPSNIASRSLSSMSTANLIINPRVQGYAWYSFISQESFVFNNINDTLSEDENIFQINYRNSKTENSKHVEWKLIAEGKPDEIVPDQLWEKLIDSLSKYDVDGNIVPSPLLSDYNMLGVSDVPRQTMIKDVFSARKVMAQSLNSLLVNIRIRDVDSWLAGDMIIDNPYWSWTDWYAVGYSKDNTEPKLVVNYDQVGGRIVPPPPSIDAEQAKILEDGDIVQVYVLDNSAYYLYDQESNTATVLVRRESTAIMINDNIYESRISKELDDDVRYILDLLSEEVFINLSVGNHGDEKVEFFFSMVKYVAFEQTNVDWFFKTTYIDVVEENKPLLSQPKFYDADDLDGYLDYLLEVKPYQTKIREFSTRYDNFIDPSLMVANDFDSLAYTTDEEGRTIPVVDPVFDPFEVPRSIRVNPVYDSVQCSFMDKRMQVETGGQEKFAAAETTTIRFGITPFYFDVFVNNVEIDAGDYTYVSSETGLLDITFNSPLSEGDYVFVREYAIGDGVTKKFIFKTMPQLSKLSYDTTYTGNLGDEMMDTDTLLIDQHYTVEENATYSHWVEATIVDDVVAPPVGAKLIPEGHIRFTHTDMEEMRLSYHGYRGQLSDIDGNDNVLDFKLVEYDIFLDAHGNLKSGWGFGFWGSYDWGDEALALIPPILQPEQAGWNAGTTQPWDSFKWNFSATAEGSKGVPNDIRKGRFIVYSGAANRYLQLQDDNSLATINGKASTGDGSGAIKYSYYTELKDNVKVTLGEQQTLDSFKNTYSEWFNCSYQGSVIDAQDFTYRNTARWDSTSWDSTGWNSDIRMPFITVDSGDYYNTTFYPNGATSEFIIDRLVKIESVILNGDAADENVYVISQNVAEGTTLVTFSSVLSVNDSLEVVYEKYFRALVDQGDASTVIYSIPYRSQVTGVTVAGVPMYVSSGYSDTLNVSTTDVTFVTAPAIDDEIVIQHKRLHDVSVTANGVDTDFTVHNSDYVGEVTVDGVIVTNYTVAESGRDVVISFSVAPLLDEIVKISFTKRDDVFSNDISKQTIDGGAFLPSNVDAGVTDEMALYKSSDAVVISYTDKSSGVSSDDCRIFVSEKNIQTLHSLTSRTTLSSIFAYGDSNVNVTDGSLFVDATVDNPSIIWVGAERVIYTGKVGNTLTGVTRMSAGTTLDVEGSVNGNLLEDYPLGTYVYSNSEVPFLPVAVTPTPPHN